MKKAPIGILDGGIEGITIFDELQSKYPLESFIYVNDILNYPYEGNEVEFINEKVKEKVELLLLIGVSCIIVVSNSIIEYCEEYLNSLNVPIVNIVNTIIDYVNEEFEHKNILFMGKEYIIKANMYQKNIRYNHLYNVFSDELETIIFNREVKTSNSFVKVFETLKTNINKDIDLVVYVDAYLKNLMIEFKEFITNVVYLDLSEILFKALQTKITLNDKGKQKSYCLTEMKKIDFMKLTYFVSNDYPIINISKVLEYKTKLLKKPKKEKTDA